MIIKPKHRHVDSAGMCYLPYLSSWNPNNCNLVGLVAVLTKVFGEDPPVRSAPKQSGGTQTVTATPVQPTPTPTPQPNYGPTPTATPSAGPMPNYPGYGNPMTTPQYPPYGNTISNTSYPPPNMTPSNPIPGPTASPQYPPPYGGINKYPNQPTMNQPNLMPNQPYENPADVAKRNAVRTLTEKTQAQLHEFNTATTKEIEELFIKSSELEERAKRADAEKDRATQELVHNVKISFITCITDQIRCRG
jgi:hypothetical protein